MSNEKEMALNGDDCAGDEDDDQHKRQTTGELLHEFWETSSLQGLPRVFTETIRFWKLFWFSLFLLLLAGCIYQMWSIFGNYYSYETATSIKLGYGNMPLPSITICNQNPIRHSMLLAHEDAADIMDTYMDIVEPAEDYDYSIMEDKVTKFYFWILDFIKSLSPQQRMEMGHQINPMVQFCNLPGHDCDRSSFTHSQSSQYGNCFTFNSAESDDHTDGPIQMTTTGINGAFSIKLFAEQKEYLRSYSYAYSFRMDLHEYNTLSLVESHPIAIATGTETFIKLKLVEKSRLEPPFGICDNEYAKNFEEFYGYKYTVQTCNATCMSRKIVEKCGCMYKLNFKYYSAEQRRNLPPCLKNTSSAMYRCAIEVYVEAEASGCSCPLPCSETKYEYQITTNAYGSADSFSELISTVCRSEENSTSPDSNCAWLKSTHPAQRQEVLRNNFAYVYIYFEDLLYDVFEDHPTYEWSQFMADFGGNVGLWIGASIFTILEIVELLTKMCVSKVHKKNSGAMERVFRDSKKNNKKKKSNQRPAEIPQHEKETLA